MARSDPGSVARTCSFLHNSAPHNSADHRGGCRIMRGRIMKGGTRDRSTDFTHMSQGSHQTFELRSEGGDRVVSQNTPKDSNAAFGHNQKGLRNKNPKSEYRNPKQIQNSKFKCSKRMSFQRLQEVASKVVGTASESFGHFDFGHLILFRISCLGFRI